MTQSPSHRPVLWDKHWCPYFKEQDMEAWRAKGTGLFFSLALLKPFLSEGRNMPKKETIFPNLLCY
jgi:hypothetical protein